jgi:hypothetical protein
MSRRFIDFSGARPGAAAIKAAGAQGVFRYLSEPTPSTSWKRATKAEILSYRKAGLDVVLNWEWYTGRMLEGASAGTHDGAEALKQAKAIGYPKGASIYFSHDTSARNDAAVLAYCRAAKKALKGYYEFDIYGSYQTVEMVKNAGLAKYGWQTVAWSNGKIGSCHIYQNGKQWFHGGADEDIVKAATGSWQDTVNAVRPKPIPTPVPDVPPAVVYYKHKPGGSLAVVSPNGEWAVFLSDQGTLQVRQYDPRVKHGVTRRTI